MSFVFKETRALAISDDQGNALGSLSGVCLASGTSEPLSYNAVLGVVTNQLVAATFAHATIQKLFFLADQNCTIKTNSTSSPANTYNLIAGRPMTWDANDGYFTNPVGTDVTAIYVTTTVTTRVKLYVLLP